MDSKWKMILIAGAIIFILILVPEIIGTMWEAATTFSEGLNGIMRNPNLKIPKIK